MSDKPQKKTQSDSGSPLRGSGGDHSKLATAISQHGSSQIDLKTQQALNTPLSDKNSTMSAEDKAFLDDLIKKVQEGTINTMLPASIRNEEVYNTLDGKTQARTDQFITTTLFTLRQIVDYYNNPHSNDSYQMTNLLQELRQKKETLEKEIGDVLKI